MKDLQLTPYNFVSCKRKLSDHIGKLIRIDTELWWNDKGEWDDNHFGSVGLLLSISDFNASISEFANGTANGSSFDARTMGVLFSQQEDCLLVEVLFDGQKRLIAVKPDYLTLIFDKLE